MAVIRLALTPGTPVLLVRGTVAHVYEDGRCHVVFPDGFTELCLPEELTPD